MNRREHLKWLAASLSGALLTTAENAWSAQLDWNLAIGLNGFASSSSKYSKTFPIEEILEFASNQGFEGVELVQGWPSGNYPRSDETDKIDSLKNLYDRYGLQIFSIQTGSGGAFDPDSEVRKKWLEEFADQARLAKILGCDCIGTWPGGGLRGQSFDQAIEHLIESFRSVGDIAESLDLIAAFEIEPPFVFNTEEHLKRILEGVNHPHFKTIYDPSHFDLMNGSKGKPHEMLQRVGVENIGYVHFTDTDGTLRDGETSKHLPCGDGHIDVEASLKTLAMGGFNGWIMMDEWQVPDPYEACRKGYGCIRDFLAD
ncbi:MAG: sugar phosphate isomerase/epimerase [Candidatus Omnitrophica bacterium]|nr:sugar phosphate isomerase/epimerase [Candidatus Omnitrophota bacterium]